MVLCAYELEREANIASNNAFLHSIGLGGDNTLKDKPVAKAPPKPKPEIPAEPSRRSGRVRQQTPLFTGLTDWFMLDEEKRAEDRRAEDQRAEDRRADTDRPRRNLKPVNYFTDEFGYVTSTSAPRKKQARTVAPPGSMAVPMMCPMPTPMPTPLVANPQELRPSTTGAQTSRSWKFKCPHCQQMWALRCDGVTLQKHECGSVRIF